MSYKAQELIKAAKAATAAKRLKREARKGPFEVLVKRSGNRCRWGKASSQSSLSVAKDVFYRLMGESRVSTDVILWMHRGKKGRIIYRDRVKKAPMTATAQGREG